ncbi:hypothetical protein AVEN_201759-1 [Araneus ventricosus]|uniref:Uncharacterized protein n=1 Tax=Araneus ventricosus TaxID=182803 RepID=A0A4Y2KG54_ARAVE|nr:hypothetical protein AVEN_201759-1 [Araneus ventricosus]
MLDDIFLLCLSGMPWPCGKVLVLRLEGSKLETRFLENPPSTWGLVHIKSDFEGHMSSRWCGRMSGEGMSPQVSSLSSDRGSKLRGLSEKKSFLKTRYSCHAAVGHLN